MSNDFTALPSAIYVWLVPSEHMLDQPGSWRIRKWDTEPFPEANFTLSASESVRSESAPSIVETYRKKIERDQLTIKTLRILLSEAHGFLNAQVVLPEDYADFEARYKAFTESLDRLAAGVAFITDTSLGGP